MADVNYSATLTVSYDDGETEESWDMTADAYYTAPAACGYPTMLHEESRSNHSPGELQVNYVWQSSTARLDDLASCRINEQVTDNPSPAQSPPFPNGLGTTFSEQQLWDSATL